MGTGFAALGREAGHRARRIVHANGDATGAEIVCGLVDRVRANPAIAVREHTTVVDLVRSEDGRRIVGVVALDRRGRVCTGLVTSRAAGTAG